MSSERRRLKGDHEGGAVAVETALVSMLLLTLIFGIVESSFLFKDWLTVSAAARAGARMGSSEPRASVLPDVPRAFADDSADQVTNAISGLVPANIQEVWVYKAIYATGLPASAGCTADCVKYNWPTGATKLTYLSGSWPASSQNACAGDVNRDALGVSVSYKHSGMGFFFKNAIVSESTVMWIEPLSSSGICKP